MSWRWGWARERKLQLLLWMSGLLPSLASLPLLYPLSQVLSTEFSLWLWSIPRAEEWGIHLYALLWSRLCLLPLCPHHTQCFCPWMHIRGFWPSRTLSLCPRMDYKYWRRQNWYQGCCPTAAMMFPSCILPTSLLLFYGENWPCSDWLWWGLQHWVPPCICPVMTEGTAPLLTELSKSSKPHWKENPEQPEKSW